MAGWPEKEKSTFFAAYVQLVLICMRGTESER
jgi:hypothetical protein